MRTSDTALFLHRLLMRAAFAGVSVFAWIFVFQLFFMLSNDVSYAFIRTTLLYTLSQTTVLLLTPYALKRLKNGMREGMVLGVLWAVGACTALSGVFAGMFGTNYASGLVLFALFLGAYRAYYRIPYRMEVVHSAHGQTPITEEIFIALIPLAASIWLISGAPLVVFLFAAGTCVALSSVPLIWMKDAYERFSWGYEQTFAELFAREHRPLFLYELVGGVQSATLFIVWPIALLLLFGWSYLSVGFFLSSTLLLILLVRLLVREPRATSPVLRGSLAASAWILRVFVVSAPAAVAVDAYVYSIAPIQSQGDPATREHHSDSAHYIDEMTALKEMSNALGRIGLGIGAAALAVLISFPRVFVFLFVCAAVFAFAEAFRTGIHREAHI